MSPNTYKDQQLPQGGEVPDDLLPLPVREIVLLGDSHFARLGRIELEMIEAQTACKVLLHNHAFGGANSGHLARRAAFEAQSTSAQFLLSVGTNDLAPWKRIPLDGFKRNLRQILVTLQASRVGVLDLVPIDESAPDLVGDPEKRSTAEVVRYRSALRDVVVESGAVCVPVAEALESRDGMHLNDGVHLNTDGTRVLIQQLSNHLESLST